MRPSLTPERWERLRAMFLEARTIEDHSRSEWLERICCGDVELKQEILAMLGAEASLPNFIAHPEIAAEQAVGGDVPRDGREIPAALPATIGPYRVKELLGHGGYGVVYLAEQDHPRRDIAIKLLRSGVVSPNALKRLTREADIMARLDHPGIARVIAAGVDHAQGGAPFVAMEMVRGRPLTQFAEATQLDSGGRLDLFVAVCDAAHHAHGRGVVHRDLKPANILVTPDGRPRILDFGVAHLVGPEANAATLSTGAAQLLGTLDYMGPEQAEGSAGSVDARSDVYSLGAILFELLAGRTPLALAGRPLPDALRQIESESPPRLGSLDRRWRGDVETIVAKALEKKPADRYQSAAQLADDLRRHLRHEPIAARPHGLIYDAAKFARRHRPIVIGVAVAVVGLVGAATWATLAGLNAQRMNRQQQRSYFLARASVLSNIKYLRALGPKTGTPEERRRIVEDLAAVEPLVADYPEDAELQRVRIWLVVGIARIYEDDHGEARAVAEYDRAIQLAKEYRERHGQHHDVGMAEYFALVRIGDLAGERRDFVTARTWYERAYMQIRHLAAAFPDQFEPADHVAWSAQRLHTNAMNRGNPAEAGPFLEQMRSQADTIARRWPDSEGALMIQLQVRQLDVQEAANALDDADVFELRREALRISRKLVAIDPDNLDYVRQYINCSVGCAFDETHHGDKFLARTLLEEASFWARMRQLRDPDSAPTSEALCVVHLYFGGLESSLGDTERAAQAYERAAIACQAWVERQPERLWAWQTRASIALARCKFFTTLGQPAEASAAGREAIDASMRAIELNEPSAESVHLLAQILHECPAPEVRDPGRALELMRRVVQTHPAPAYFRDLARIELTVLGPEQARLTFEHALSLAPPSSPALRRELENELSQLGDR